MNNRVSETRHTFSGYLLLSDLWRISITILGVCGHIIFHSEHTEVGMFNIQLLIPSLYGLYKVYTTGKKEKIHQGGAIAHSIYSPPSHLHGIVCHDEPSAKKYQPVAQPLFLLRISTLGDAHLYMPRSTSIQFHKSAVASKPTERCSQEIKKKTRL